ncbi:LOW QUALITY PROTEIN: hypothetical protein V2J09_010732 [Rumex salicifolius]
MSKKNLIVHAACGVVVVEKKQKEKIIIDLDYADDELAICLRQNGAKKRIVCQYEEIWASEVNDFVSITDRAYNNEKILEREKPILGKLEWNIIVPTSYIFLFRFIKASIDNEEVRIHNLNYISIYGFLNSCINWSWRTLVYFLAKLAHT